MWCNRAVGGSVHGLSNPSAADHRRGQLSAAGLAGGSRHAAPSWRAAHPCSRHVAHRRTTCWSKRRTTPPSWRSARWSGPGSISSPMARSGGRATPIALPSRWRASTPTRRASCGLARGRMTKVPRVVGQIRRVAPVEVRDAEFLRAQRDRATKITLPGPFTLSRQVAERFLPRRGRTGDGLRRRGERGTARAEGDRRRRRATG